MVIAYILRRLVQIIPLLLLISIVVFTLIELQPGDPIIDSLVLANPEMTAEDIAQLRRIYGVDLPIPVKYSRWLMRAVQGDLGYSRLYRIPALDFILERRLPNTLALSGLAFFLALAVSIPTGIFVALRQYSLPDYLISFLNFLGFSTPVFWLGIMLIILTSLVITVPTTQGAPTAPLDASVRAIEEEEVGGALRRNVVLETADGIVLPIPIRDLRPRVQVGSSVTAGEALATVRRELLPAGGFTSGVRPYVTEGSPRSNVAGVASIRHDNGSTIVTVEGFLGTESYTIPPGFRVSIEDGQRVRNNQTLARRYTFRQVMAFVADRLYHLILPAFTLSVIQMAQWTRFMRSSMLEVMNLDYVRTARSKGLSEQRITYKHTLRNAMIPIITLIGLAVPGLVSGAVLTETVFNWPGMGTALLEALISKDYNVAMAVIVLLSFLTISFNLLADIAYALVDPRIQYR